MRNSVDRDKLSPEDRVKFDATVEESKRIAAEILARIPRDLATAKDSVMASATVFYQSRDRYSARVFADACRRAAKKFRRSDAPVPKLRIAFAEAIETQAGVLDEAAEALYKYDAAVASDAENKRVYDAGLALQAAEKKSQEALHDFTLGIVRALTEQLQAEGKAPASDPPAPAPAAPQP